MKVYILFLFLAVSHFLPAVHAQTICLGANCDSGWDGYLPSDRFGNDHSVLDRFLTDGAQRQFVEDPEKLKCVRTCKNEYQENVLTCADAHEGDITFTAADSLEACLIAAKRRLIECLPSPGLMQCF